LSRITLESNNLCIIKKCVSTAKPRDACVMRFDLVGIVVANECDEHHILIENLVKSAAIVHVFHIRQPQAGQLALRVYLYS